MLTLLLLTQLPQQLPTPTYYPPNCLQRVCLYLEIMDPKEVNHYLVWNVHRMSEFRQDFKTMVERYKVLNLAPPARITKNFPPKDAISEIAVFNRTHAQYLRELQSIYRSETLTRQIQENDKLYEFWDLIRDCAQDYYYVAFRRGQLLKLINLVGRDRFYEMIELRDWPPPVPVWRFYSP